MTALPTININQIAPTPVRGMLALDIMAKGVLPGVVSASQATALKAGDKVKLDTASGKVPSFIAATASDVGIGFVVFDTKNAAPVAGDAIGVAYFGGPVMWMAAGGTIAAQGEVEMNSDGFVIASAAAKVVGYALDPGVANDMIRVVITNPNNLLIV